MTPPASSSRTAPLRAAIVANIPAPYRVPVFARLAAMPGLSLKVFFCSGREPDREWSLPEMTFAHEFLAGAVARWRGRFIHANRGVARALAAFDPNVVVTTGFNPSHLLAWRHAAARGAGHVAMTDGTLQSESRLGWMHRAARRAVFRRSRAFVGASEGSMALYRSYGLPETALFRSALCVDNAAFGQAAARGHDVREYDFIFCGRFAAGKLPTFAIEVASGVADRLRRRVRLLMVGSGPMDAEVRSAARGHAGRLDCVFAGFATQAALPGLYAQARVLLFPTRGDTWGVVANEACAAGLPVLVSPQAGVAGELVRDLLNGRVLELELERWIDEAAGLCRDAEMWTRMSANSRMLVAPYCHERAALGLAEAILAAARAQ